MRRSGKSCSLFSCISTISLANAPSSTRSIESKNSCPKGAQLSRVNSGIWNNDKNVISYSEHQIHTLPRNFADFNLRSPLRITSFTWVVTPPQTCFSTRNKPWIIKKTQTQTKRLEKKVSKRTIHLCKDVLDGFLFLFLACQASDLSLRCTIALTTAHNWLKFPLISKTKIVCWLRLHPWVTIYGNHHWEQQMDWWSTIQYCPRATKVNKALFCDVTRWLRHTTSPPSCITHWRSP